MKTKLMLCYSAWRKKLSDKSPQRAINLTIIICKIILGLCVLWSLIVMLGGCDDRFDFLKDVNRAPVLEIQKPGIVSEDLSLLTDAVKISLKHNNLPYAIQLYASDQETLITNIHYRFLTGNGSLRMNAQILGGSIPLSAGSATIYFEPQDVGKVAIEFWIEDDFTKRTVARADLNVFLNLPPVAGFEFEFIGTHGPYEYRLDASQSTDQDHAQGGQIQAYHFIINDSYHITTSQPVVIHSFEGPGPDRRDVKLEVIDNDGVKSALFPLVVK